MVTSAVQTGVVPGQNFGEHHRTENESFVFIATLVQIICLPVSMAIYPGYRISHERSYSILACLSCWNTVHWHVRIIALYANDIWLYLEKY